MNLQVDPMHLFEVENDIITPEKKLLSHLLRRALLDCAYGDGLNKTQATAWLLGKTYEGKNSHHFTFWQVCQYLNLSGRLQNQIQALAANPAKFLPPSRRFR